MRWKSAGLLATCLDIFGYLTCTANASNHTVFQTNSTRFDSNADLSTQKLEIDQFLNSLLAERNQTPSYQFVQGIQAALSQEIQISETFDTTITLSGILQPWIDAYFSENSPKNIWEDGDSFMYNVSRSWGVEQYLFCTRGMKYCVQGWNFMLDIFDFVGDTIELLRVIERGSKNSAQLDLLGMGEIKVVVPCYFEECIIQKQNRHLIDQLVGEDWSATFNDTIFSDSKSIGSQIFLDIYDFVTIDLIEIRFNKNSYIDASDYYQGVFRVYLFTIDDFEFIGRINWKSSVLAKTVLTPFFPEFQQNRWVLESQPQQFFSLFNNGYSYYAERYPNFLKDFKAGNDTLAASGKRFPRGDPKKELIFRNHFKIPRARRFHNFYSEAQNSTSIRNETSINQAFSYSGSDADRMVLENSCSTYDPWSQKIEPNYDLINQTANQSYFGLEIDTVDRFTFNDLYQSFTKASLTSQPTIDFQQLVYTSQAKIQFLPEENSSLIIATKPEFETSSPPDKCSGQILFNYPQTQNFEIQQTLTAQTDYSTSYSILSYFTSASELYDGNVTRVDLSDMVMIGLGLQDLLHSSSRSTPINFDYWLNFKLESKLLVDSDIISEDVRHFNIQAFHKNSKSLRDQNEILRLTYQEETNHFNASVSLTSSFVVASISETLDSAVVFEFGSGKNLLAYLESILNVYQNFFVSMWHLTRYGSTVSQNRDCQTIHENRQYGYRNRDYTRWITSITPFLYFDELLTAYVEFLQDSVVDILENPSVRFYPEVLTGIFNDSSNATASDALSTMPLSQNLYQMFDELQDELYELESMMDTFRNFWTVAVVSSTEALGYDLLQEVVYNVENILCSIWNVQYERKAWSRFIRSVARGTVQVEFYYNTNLIIEDQNV